MIDWWLEGGSGRLVVRGGVRGEGVVEKGGGEGEQEQEQEPTEDKKLPRYGITFSKIWHIN